MKTHDASPVSNQSPKPRQHRNREVSSRFLPSSPPPSSIITTSMDSGECHSPVRRKPTSPAADSRRHKITEEPGFMRHQLWPSSAAAMKKNSGTLADHISEDRIIEQLDDKTTKIISSISSKENDRPIIGGSSRYLGTPSSSSSSSSSVKKHASKGSTIFPGRLSVDNENAKSLSSRRNSFSLTNSVDLESEYGARKLGVEVPSRYMNDVKTRRGRRGTSDSNILDVNSDSSVLKRFTLKTAIKRANSLTGYKSSKSQWALSPGRSESPAMSVESMDKTMSFSSLKHSTTPTKEVKGVEKFLSMGFDIFKSKKPLVNSSPIGFGNSNSEAVHQLRMLDNRFIQWRYANARAQAVNLNISHLAQSNLIYAWDGITKLQHSVLKKKIQFAREKLQMKITFILYSQMKLLEAWGGMERQHVSAITATKECLHSVVCRVPLLEGAKVNIQSTSIALRQTCDLTASIKSMLTSFSPSVDNTAAMLSELAKVVAQERQLLQEFYDLFHTLSVFELQERSAKCKLIQLEGWQRMNYQLQQLPPEITT